MNSLTVNFKNYRAAHQLNNPRITFNWGYHDGWVEMNWGWPLSERKFAPDPYTKPVISPPLENFNLGRVTRITVIRHGGASFPVSRKNSAKLLLSRFLTLR